MKRRTFLKAVGAAAVVGVPAARFVPIQPPVKQWYGVGIAEKMLPYQEKLTALHQQMLERAYRASNPRIMVEDGEVIYDTYVSDYGVHRVVPNRYRAGRAKHVTVHQWADDELTPA